ncbi:hypothetical protein K440DRAFT_645412 [Wilcoxina mikolae CBS 423.85]|nr:hypothetical protein K440DRAFT_645412 [Wilcoxina mikolae CBS 423.85]
MFKPIEKAFDQYQIAIVPRVDSSEWVLKIADPSLLKQDIFASLTRAEINALQSAVEKPEPTFWRDLQDRVVFSNYDDDINTPLPYRRIMWYHATLVEMKATNAGWKKHIAFSVESFFSDIDKVQELATTI